MLTATVKYSPLQSFFFILWKPELKKMDLDQTAPFWSGLVWFVALGLSQQLWLCRDGQSTFFLGKLDQAVNKYFVHILSLVIDNNPCRTPKCENVIRPGKCENFSR